MANIHDAFPSSWLKADDLPQKTRVAVVISDVTIEQIGDDRKPVVKFKGKDKGLVLNKTNAEIIASMLGPETDNWRGKTIRLYATKVQYSGKMVPAIRVYEEPPPEEAAVAADPTGDLHEDIPF